MGLILYTMLFTVMRPMGRVLFSSCAEPIVDSCCAIWKMMVPGHQAAGFTLCGVMVALLDSFAERLAEAITEANGQPVAWFQVHSCTIRRECWLLLGTSLRWVCERFGVAF